MKKVLDITVMIKEEDGIDVSCYQADSTLFMERHILHNCCVEITEEELESSMLIAIYQFTLGAKSRDILSVLDEKPAVVEFDAETTILIK